MLSSSLYLITCAIARESADLVATIAIANGGAYLEGGGLHADNAEGAGPAALRRHVEARAPRVDRLPAALAAAARAVRTSSPHRTVLNPMGAVRAAMYLAAAARAARGLAVAAQQLAALEADRAVSTSALHLSTAPHHCTSSLHLSTAPHHCTTSLHRITRACGDDSGQRSPRGKSSTSRPTCAPHRHRRRPRQAARAPPPPPRRRPPGAPAARVSTPLAAPHR